MKKMFAIVVLAAFTAVPALAQTSLTDQEVAAAIELGRKTRINNLGIEITNSSSSINWGKMAGSAIRATFDPLGSINANDFWKDFKGRLHTPTSYIAYRAAESKKLGTKFTATADDRRPVVRFSYAASLGYITDVVLRKNDDDENGVPGTCVTGLSAEVLKHIPNTKLMCSGFEFPLQDVQNLISDEFTVTLHASDGQNGEVKHFTIKRDKLARLH